MASKLDISFLTPEQNEARKEFNIYAPHCFVYILRCAGGVLYTGISNNPIQRFVNHCNGTGAKFTRSFPPKELVFIQNYHFRADAAKIEYKIKQLTRQQKLEMIDANEPSIPDIFRLKRP